MRGVKITLFSIVFMIIQGCGSSPVKPMPPNQAPVEKTTVKEKNYSVGELKESYVGQPIIRVKSYTVNKTLEENYYTPVDIKMHGRFNSHVQIFPAGTPFKAIGTYDVPPAIEENQAGQSNFPTNTSKKHGGKQYVALEPPSDFYRLLYLLVDDYGNYEDQALIGSMRFTPSSIVTDWYVEPSEIKFEKRVIEKIDASAAYDNYEIIYSGATRDGIRMMYREYSSDNLARPAYFQELFFEPKAGKIRFRNIGIDIIKYDGNSISYKVFSDSLK